MEAPRDLIVSTKKLKPRLASLLQSRPGFRYREENFIRIAAVVDPGGLADLDPDAPIVFTSGNALRLAADHYASVRNFSGTVYTLEGTSAAEARRRIPGAQIRGKGQNSAELAVLINLEQAPGGITFFCGNKRQDALPEMLRGQGFGVREVLVYETGFAPHQIEESPAAVLFFSPSGVESYLMANALGKGTGCIAIGPTTANLLRREQFGIRILTAPTPSQESVVETLLNYLNTINV
jgi:uroporphyrinogen-III synthase